MTIFVCSCDKDEDLWQPFSILLEKYYPEHPRVVYACETKKNPYYETICIDYPLDKWTKRIRESLDKVDDDTILLMIDDLFIRTYVDTSRLGYASEVLNATENKNVAYINLEQSFDDNDIKTRYKGFKKRCDKSPYKISILCGLWKKSALLKILSEDKSPWEVEYAQKDYGYDCLINSGDFIIDFGYKAFVPTNVFKGKWCKNVIPFFESENIDIDYSIRGWSD